MSLKKVARYCFDNNILIMLIIFEFVSIYVVSGKMIHYDEDPAACFAGLTFMLLAASVATLCIHFLVHNYPFSSKSIDEVEK